jgi:hypothetical protein
MKMCVGLPPGRLGGLAIKSGMVTSVSPFRAQR